ncbi:MAG: ABC transporter substrate-binding protein [Pseudomonadota bacterium]
MERKSIFVSVTVLAVSLILFSIVPAYSEEVRGVTDDTIKVGFIMAQTGPAANVAVPLTNGVRHLVRYANEQGGIHGRKIILLVEDDRYNIPLAITSFKKLVFKDKVGVMMGPTSTGAITALWKGLQKEKMPLICAIAPEVTVKPFKRYIFTILDVYPNQMKVLVDYIMKDLKAKDPRIAIVHPDNETGKVDLASTVERLKSYNLKPVTKEVLNPGAFDASSQVLNLRRAKTTHILLAGFIPQPAALILKDMKKYGLSVPVFGSWATCAEEVIQMAGDACKDWYAVNHLSSWYDKEPGVVKMREITLKYEPGTEKSSRGKLYGHGWVMATILIEGLKRAGRDLNGEAFVDALETIKDFDSGGLTGPISYSSTSHKGRKFVEDLQGKS